MLAVVLLTLAIVCISVWCSQYFSLANRPSAWQTLAVFTAATGFLLILAIVCLPWSISRIAAAQFLYHTWPVWSMLGRASFSPGVACQSTGRGAAPGYRPHKRRGGRGNDGRRNPHDRQRRPPRGSLEEDAREMIEGVIELRRRRGVAHHDAADRDAHVAGDTPWDEVVESMIESGHTRVPVYDKTRDDIVGILYSKDLLPELAKGPDEPRRPLTAVIAQAAVRAGNQAGRRPAAMVSKEPHAHCRRAGRVRRRLRPGHDRRRAGRDRRRNR